jgi:hypothetical protein
VNSLPGPQNGATTLKITTFSIIKWDTTYIDTQHNGRALLCWGLCLVHWYWKSLNRLLKVCNVPTTSAVLIAFFSSFWLQPLAVLMKQTRQLVNAVMQSIYLDVYSLVSHVNPSCWEPLCWMSLCWLSWRPQNDWRVWSQIRFINKILVSVYLKNSFKCSISKFS